MFSLLAMFKDQHNGLRVLPDITYLFYATTTSECMIDNLSQREIVWHIYMRKSTVEMSLSDQSAKVL